MCPISIIVLKRPGGHEVLLLFSFRCRLHIALWNIRAARFFCVWISGQSVCAGSRSTQISLNSQEPHVPSYLDASRKCRKSGEHDRSRPIPAHRCRLRREESRSERPPFVRDEDESLAFVEAARCAPD